MLCACVGHAQVTDWFSCYTVLEAPLWHWICLHSVTRTGGSIMGLSVFILCYPEPQVPLWNWLFVILTCLHLFCICSVNAYGCITYAYAWFMISVYDLDKLWIWYETELWFLNLYGFIHWNPFTLLLFTELLLTVYIMYVGEPACDQGQSWRPSIMILSANRCASRGGPDSSLFPWLFLCLR